MISPDRETEIKGRADTLRWARDTTLTAEGATYFSDK
jgi:hypothetical protein